jgi:hypothetical protein
MTTLTSKRDDHSCFNVGQGGYKLFFAAVWLEPGRAVHFWSNFVVSGMAFPVVSILDDRPGPLTIRTTIHFVSSSTRIYNFLLPVALNPVSTYCVPHPPSFTFAWAGRRWGCPGWVRARSHRSAPFRTEPRLVRCDRLEPEYETSARHGSGNCESMSLLTASPPGVLGVLGVVGALDSFAHVVD